MRFQTELIPARLIRRYKRFLADCTLPDGREVTAHCANPGSMMGLAEPGSKIWLEPNDDHKKKLKYGWRLVEHENGHFTGVDTSLPNKIVKQALELRQIAALSPYENVQAEVKYAQNSRVDFLLSQPGLPDAYVEVKSATLSRQAGLAEFPDSVTSRGSKHLTALGEVAQSGTRAVLLYLIQRTDCSDFAIAKDIDPVYARAHHIATQQGLETLYLTTHISQQGIEIAHALAPNARAG